MCTYKSDIFEDLDQNQNLKADPKLSGYFKTKYHLNKICYDSDDWTLKWPKQIINVFFSFNFLFSDAANYKEIGDFVEFDASLQEISEPATYVVIDTLPDLNLTQNVPKINSNKYNCSFQITQVSFFHS